MKKNQFLISIVIVFITTQTSFSQCFKNVNAGYFNTFAVKHDGSIWAWGKNDVSQLGINTTSSKNIPTQIESEINWSSVSSGQYFTSAIKNDGTLWAWGNNDIGQLGIGTTDTKLTPTKVGVDSDWLSIGVGQLWAIAIKTNGTLWSWGAAGEPLGNGSIGGDGSPDLKIPTQIGLDNNWSKISIGQRVHSLALKNDGTLWAWGNNTGGQLGNGTEYTNNKIPTQIGNSKDWKLMSAGGFHSAAIKNDGTLWIWGLNNFGQIGNNTTVNISLPLQIGTESNWLKISGGGWHTVAIKNDGTLWAWGLNSAGQLGDGSNINKSLPQQIGVDTNWSQIYAGLQHTIAIKNDGSVWVFGSNGFGELGDATNTKKNIPTAIDCPTILGINENQLEKSLSIYPNPAKNQINLQIPNNETVDKIVITDLTGKIVLTQTENTTQVNVAPLSNGMYLLQAFSGKEQFQTKFIKE